jgi:hypothetical protein
VFATVADERSIYQALLLIANDMILQLAFVTLEPVADVAFAPPTGGRGTLRCAYELADARENDASVQLDLSLSESSSRSTGT